MHKKKRSNLNGLSSRRICTIKGSLMFEAMAVLGILMLITPAIVKLTQQSLRAMQQVVYGTQLLTERIAITEQITSDFRDINGIFGSVSGCCVQNSTHVMCYDTKKGRFRRRKRKRSSTRYYTHYIGEHNQWEDVLCRVDNGVFLVQISPKSDQLDGWRWPQIIGGYILENHPSKGVGGSATK